MRHLTILALCGLLAGCAGGTPSVDQARNDHDLGALENAELAAESQLSTGARDLRAIVSSSDASRETIPQPSR